MTCCTDAALDKQVGTPGSSRMIHPSWVLTAHSLDIGISDHTQTHRYQYIKMVYICMLATNFRVATQPKNFSFPNKSCAKEIAELYQEIPVIPSDLCRQPHL